MLLSRLFPQPYIIILHPHAFTHYEEKGQSVSFPPTMNSIEKWPRIILTVSKLIRKKIHVQGDSPYTLNPFFHYKFIQILEIFLNYLKSVLVWIQISVFFNENTPFPSYFTVNYLSDNFFENIDVPKLKFDLV